MQEEGIMMSHELDLERGNNLHLGSALFFFDFPPCLKTIFFESKCWQIDILSVVCVCDSSNSVTNSNIRATLKKKENIMRKVGCGELFFYTLCTRIKSYLDVKYRMRMLQEESKFTRVKLYIYKKTVTILQD